MRRDIHPFMEDAHDVNPFRRREVKNEMPIRRIDPKASIDFIVDSAELRVVRERFEGLIQRTEVLLRLGVAPLLDRVVSDVIEVGPGFGPERHLRHPWARETSPR